MAMTIANYVDPAGDTNTLAYFRVHTYTHNYVRSPTGTITEIVELEVWGWTSESAHDSELDPIVIRQYTINEDEDPTEFAAYFEEADLIPVDQSPELRAQEYLINEVAEFSSASEV